MNFTHQIYSLSDMFYNTYPKEQFPEILEKKDRPYNCLLIETSYDYYICIPYRSLIVHENAYFFTETERSRRTRSGLDYSKMVIIKDTEYFNDSPALIDNDEYRETIRNINTIMKDAKEFVNEYLKYKRGTSTLSSSVLRKKYYYSSLKYFHEELGL